MDHTTIRAIFFDLDDTLVAQDSSDEEALAATCHHIPGVADPRALVEAVRRHAREGWNAGPLSAYCRAIQVTEIEGLWARFLGDDSRLVTLREWAPAYRAETWRRALADRGSDDRRLAARLAALFQDERRGRHTVFPETRTVLADLRERYRLALVTNGAPDLQHEKVRGAGLESFFDTVVVSGEIGVGKPDPRMFTLPLERLGLDASAAVMVGNSVAHDIAGAQRAGVRGIWINRTGRARPDGDVSPDAEITSLAGLYDLRWL